MVFNEKTKLVIIRILSEKEIFKTSKTEAIKNDKNKQQ